VPAQERAVMAGAPLGEWLAEVFARGPAGAAITSLDLSLVAVNQAFARMLARDAQSLLRTPLDHLVHPDDRPRALAALERMRSSAETSLRLEHRLVRSDGSVVWVEQEVTLLPEAEGREAHLHSHFQDVTDRERDRASLTHQVFHDPLTGLPNRALLEDRIAHALARSARHGSRVSVLFIDVDRFKAVNDGLGHAGGDELLTGLAGRLRGALRAGDTLARLGGDEFVLVSEDGVAREGEELAARIEELVAEPFVINGRETAVSVSIGIVRARAGDDAQMLLRQADAAMYRAKQRGRARSIVYDDDLHAETTARLATEDGLRRALDERHEFAVHYQPILDLVSGRVAALEALTRWNRSDGVQVQPGEFLAVAEDTGMILPIGEWLLHEATTRLGAWRREVAGAEDLGVAVNISARQLRAPNLVDVLRRALDDAQLPADAVCLEIAEDVVMDDVDRSLEAFLVLRSLGVRLAIDDFGTGYTSISRLRRLPVDSVKIDRGVVAGMTDPRGADTVTVSAIVSLAKALGLIAVAEGVETDEQRTMLVRMGCQLGQGFLWQRPMPADEVGPWLSPLS
jgi:diguanylate cyclase (GGDEF)-like protein/PAS domain S-box-containing protein